MSRCKFIQPNRIIMIAWIILLCRMVFITTAAADFDNGGQNPAFKIHVTSKGLNFISRIAKSMLLDFLKDGSGKTIETKNPDGVVMKWSNLKIQKYNDDLRSDVLFSPGIGVEYRLRELDLKMTSDYTILTQSNPSGVLTVTMESVSVALLISMLNSGGRFKPFLEDCRCTIDNADLQINKGSSQDLAKYFRDDVINGQAKSYMQNQICLFARTIFVPKIQRTFGSYPISVKLFDDIYYNYSLTEDPVVNNDHVVTSYSGNAYIHLKNGANDSRVPFTASQVVDENCQDRMMCLYMSNYSLRSLIYFMSKQHRFDYNFTKIDTPTFAKYLRTDCPKKDDICAGTVITSLPQKYPNSNLEIHIRQIPGKEQVIIKNGVVNITGAGFVTGYVKRANGKKEFLYSSNIDSYSTMKKPIFQAKNTTIETKFDANHFVIYNVTSKNPDINADSLSLLTGFAMDNYVTPDMQRTLGKGLKLPKLIEFDMVNGVAAFEDDRIMMAADFCQTQDECKQAQADAAAERAKNTRPDYDSIYEGS